jgi:branched-chain amino acid transport system ATP-binding protein
VSLAFGGVKALSDVSLRRARARDPRHHRPQRRRQELDAERDQRRLPPAAGPHHVPRRDAQPHGAAPRAALGIARTFQSLALFKGMSVLDNILAGPQPDDEANIFLQALRVGPALREEIEHRKRVEEIIDFLEIQHVRKTRWAPALRPAEARGPGPRARRRAAGAASRRAHGGMNVEEKQDMSRFILDVNDEFGTTSSSSSTTWAS